MCTSQLPTLTLRGDECENPSGILLLTGPDPLENKTQAWKAPTSMNWIKASARKSISSRRDSMIVARHEVPGTAPPQKSRPVGYGLIHTGVRTDSRDWREEISNAGSLSRKEMIHKMHWRRLRPDPSPYNSAYEIGVAKAVQLIKAGSSAWIHQRFPNLRNFAWQPMAYSASVSPRHGSITIEQQLERHRTRTFQEEYLAFLKKHGAHFDEKYLWDQLRPIIPYPTGRFFRGTLSQALRAWLRSACPSGTKAIRPSKGLALS